MEEKTKEKQGRGGVRDTMKIEWNVGSVNDEKRFYGEVKNFQFPMMLLKVMDVKPAGLIVTLGGDWGVQAPWELVLFKL